MANTETKKITENKTEPLFSTQATCVQVTGTTEISNVTFAVLEKLEGNEKDQKTVVMTIDFKSMDVGFAKRFDPNKSVTISITQ